MKEAYDEYKCHIYVDYQQVERNTLSFFLFRGKNIARSFSLERKTLRGIHIVRVYLWPVCLIDSPSKLIEKILYPFKTLQYLQGQISCKALSHRVENVLTCSRILGHICISFDRLSFYRLVPKKN